MTTSSHVPPATAVVKAPPPTFTTFFTQVDDGRLAANATEELEVLIRELRNVAQIANTKPPGRIVLTISIAALPGGEMMNVVGAIKVAMPTRPKAQSIFWRTKENCLSAANPAQREIDFKDVSTAEVHAAAGATLRSI